MLFHVLGPLEVHTATTHRIGIGKEATVLVTLLLQPNAWVTVDQLIDGTWQQQDVPASAVANLRTYLWRLRRLLPDGPDRIERRGDAYRITVNPGEVDADRAGELAGEARRIAAAGDPAGAITLVDQALGLWRGRPFSGIETAGANTAAARLDDLHLELREHLAELQLGLGRGPEAVATLRRLTADAPLRETA